MQTFLSPFTKIQKSLNSHLTGTGVLVFECCTDFCQIFGNTIAAKGIHGHHALHGVFAFGAFFEQFVEFWAVQIDAGLKRHFFNVHIFVVDLGKDEVFHVGAGGVVAKKYQSALDHFGIF